MPDLISRRAAIDALELTTWYHQNRNGVMVEGANDQEHQAWYKAEDVYKALNNLPSAQQWIPCSERLPEEGKEVLISSDSGIYIAELEILDGNVYWNETIEYRSVKKVSAWMPLPEAYKGEGNG